MASKKLTKKPAKKTTKKTAAKKTAAKKTTAKKTTAQKTAAKETAAKKTATKKTATKKTATKKTATKKTATKKTAAKKTAAKKTAAKKTAAKKTAAKKTTKRQAATTPTGTATIVQHVFLSATPTDVYRALTDPTVHTAFTGDLYTGDAVEGGAFTSFSGYASGTHEKLEPGRLITQSWRTTEFPDDAPSSRLEFVLEEVPGGTEVTMTHSDLPADQAENYRQGWIDFYWTPLRAHFAK
jgi:activator of HSP90 ATPase